MKILYPLKPKLGTHSDFYVFDCEAGIKKQTKEGLKIKWDLQATQDRFIFGVVYGRNYTKVIHNLKEFQDEFKDPRYKNKKVFAHNFGRFDGSLVFGNIFDLDSEAIFIGSRFISCTNGNCIFGDSLNIYKASVKEIGIKLGKVKLGMDGGEYKESLWPRDQAKDINGCIRDCEIVWDALYEMFSECGDIKLTIGSCSMSYFRRYSMEMWIEANDFIKPFWQSYYGGRVEAIHMGKTHAHVIDVNSLYPRCMKECKFPNPKYLKYENITDTKYFLKNILPHFEGCCKVSVNHPVLFIGLLPYRHKGKLMFPCGNFSGIYNFNELRFAISKGVKITSIEWACYSEPMESPFIKFVDDLSLKKFHANVEGRELDEWKYKYLLNNLYGKMGQRIEEKTIYLHDYVSQYDIIREHQKKKTFIKLLPFSVERSDAFLIVKEKKKKEISYSIPSFPSYITSQGRIILAEEILKREKNYPIYFDTDSIFYTVDDGTIKSSNILGEWKIENKIVTEIRGPKNYSFIKNNKEITRIKGVPSKAVKITDKKRLKELKTTEGKAFEFTSLVGTKEGLRRNLEIGIPLKRTKVISGKYEKRIVNKDGTTKPIII